MNLKKSKKIVVFSAVLATVIICTVVLTGAFSAYGAPKTATAGTSPSQTDIAGDGGTVSLNKGGNPEQDKQDIRALVEAFGKTLRTVSLSAAEDVAAASLEENYRSFVTPELLQKWKADPQSAPGRTVSSPWPDRIDILSMEIIDSTRYAVQGEIIEVTSVEMENGGAAAKRPVTLTVQRVNGRWLIDSVTMGEYAQHGPIVYENTRYGFRFYLPESWKGYSIVEEQWKGTKDGELVETGPQLLIRHPDWTTGNPRQDIPIMIFTQAQWNALQREEFFVSAAPIGPSKLGGNSVYVFALPPRYNFAFLPGYEEVEEILKGNPLWPTKPLGEDNPS